MQADVVMLHAESIHRGPANVPRAGLARSGDHVDQRNEKVGKSAKTSDRHHSDSALVTSHDQYCD